MRKLFFVNALLCSLVMFCMSSPCLGAEKTDGKITKEDFPKKMVKKFEEYDLNSDGMIDPTEKQTYLLEAKQKRLEELEKNLKDKDGDGKITKDDLPKNLQRAFKKMDQNSDGQISDDEKSAFLKAQTNKMQNEKSSKTKKKKKQKD
jgi:Ca2+-binding EF-hand superfamily protein